MAVTQMKRVRPDGHQRFKIPTGLLAVIMALVVNFGRARLKDWGILSSSTGTSSSILDLFVGGGPPPPNYPSLTDTVAGLEAAESATGSETRVISNFVSDPQQLQKYGSHALWEDCTKLGQQRLRDTGEEVLWLDYGATPTNIWEEMAVQIWQDHPLLTRPSGSGTPPIAGYEYWCNILYPATPLDWHVDKDEVVFEQQQQQQQQQNSESLDLTSILKTPTLGAVWYGYPHVLPPNEGFLELFPFTPHEIPDPTIFHPTQLLEYTERIRPVYNRLIFLNVSEWHRVTPLTASTTTTDTKRPPPARYTLAVNIWKEKPKLKP